MNTGERRRLIVLLGVAGFLVVVLLAKFVLFSGGGGSHATATTFFGSSPTGGGVSTTATTLSSRSTSPPATFDVFATKNPFEPVVIVTPTTSPTGSTTPTTPTTGGTGTGQTTTSTAAPSNEPSAGTSVALLDVFKQGDGTPMAKVQVGSTVYTVGVGQTFATSYRVVSLSSPCGQFLFGDAPFRLCEGEEVIK